MAYPIEVYKNILRQTIVENGLQAFYPKESSLERAAALAVKHIDAMCYRWGITPKDGCALVKLALYDVVLYIDNSGSMKFEEGGARINDLKFALERIVDVVRIFDSDGFDVRFMNGRYDDSAMNNITDATTIKEYIDRPHFFNSITPLGTELQRQILGPMLADAERGNLQKPQLIITITDGMPMGESQNALQDAIEHAIKRLSKTKYGTGAVSFQFAQVGNDGPAQKFLAELDSHPVVGTYVDCTSNMEQESGQTAQFSKPFWVLKLLLGAIDDSYDLTDEIGSSPNAQYRWPPPAQDSGHKATSKQSYGKFDASQSSGQQPDTQGPPPSYDDSLQPQYPVYSSGPMARGSVSPSAPRKESRSIFKSALSHFKSSRGRDK